MKRVFVSSTFVDLEAHRDAVIEAITRLGAVPVAMEQFGARDARPKDECLRIVREETDVFVGIYAHRYGSIPEGDDLSITELEYVAAFERKLPIFVYRVDPSYEWPEQMKDDGPAALKIAAFRERIRRDYIMAPPFTTPDDLAKGVVADLGRSFASPEPDVVHHGLFHQPPIDWVSPVTKNRHLYKVVVFDMDGTLLRGDDFEFSWEAIWNSDRLGFGPHIQGDLKREYMTRSAASKTPAERIAAYQEWCDKAVAKFRTRGLTRAQLKELTASTRLTQNCREALTQLRQEGLATAIVSGGVDTFLEDTFPDFRDFVDFAFINRLTFDRDGVIEGVIATAYDFQGKVDALNVICRQLGCEPSSEAAFVGDQLNDDWILLAVDQAIAYTSHDVSARGTHKEVVTEDDLLKILPLVVKD